MGEPRKYTQWQKPDPRDYILYVSIEVMPRKGKFTEISGCLELGTGIIM